jgi:putative hydrolase of the HAD superfamily
MGSIRCVTFDIDDTLFLERDYVRSGFDAVGRWLHERKGIEGFSRLAFSEFESGTRGVIFDRAMASLGIRADRPLLDAMVREYRSHSPSIELLADAEATLRSLAGRMKLAIVSDGPLSSQSAKAHALAIDRWCDPIVLTEALGAGYGKPHPRAFELVQQRFGFAGHACVYVADNPIKDFAGPKGLGWRTVRVRRALGLHAALDSGPDVDVEISDLEPLTTIVEEFS